MGDAVIDQELQHEGRLRTPSRDKVLFGVFPIAGFESFTPGD